jgi:hypothetical protein
LSSYNDSKLEFGLLSTTGTYSVWLVPRGIDTGTVDLRLISEATGTFVINAIAAPITLGTAQNGRYTFSANANDLVTLAVTSFATTPTGGSALLKVYDPSSTQIWYGNVGSGSSGTWQLPQFTATGTYTLRVMPSDTRAASMSIQFTR